MDTIMAVKINHRMKKAPEVQSLLTKYGCIIRVRLGLHEAGDSCSNEGLILLQLAGSDGEIAAFEKEIGAMEGVTAKTMQI